jgi:hypothetical protein
MFTARLKRLRILQHVADIDRDDADNYLALAQHMQRLADRRRRFWVRYWMLSRHLLG